MYKEMTDSWVQADLKYLSEKICYSLKFYLLEEFLRGANKGKIDLNGQ